MNRILVMLSCRLYHSLLIVYPRAFLHDYGIEMQQIFKEECRASLQTRGVPGLLLFWLRVLGDLIVSAGSEHLAVLDWKTTLLWILALLLGVVVGLLDFQSKEVQGPVLIILIFTFLFGIASPRRVWRWAIAIGLGVPLLHIINALLKLPPPYPVEPNVLAAFLALIPAFLGAYAGAFVRWGATSMQDL